MVQHASSPVSVDGQRVDRQPPAPAGAQAAAEPALADPRPLDVLPGAGSDASAENVLLTLRLAQEQLGPGDRLIADRLAAIGEELALLQEEVTVQLAELDAAAEARLEERHLVRRLVSSLPVAFLVTDVNGSVVAANAAAAALLGVPERTLVRKPVFSYVETAARREARTLLTRAVDDEGSAEGVLSLAPRSGTARRHHVVLTRTIGGAGDQGGDTEVSWVLHPAENDDAGEAADRTGELRYRATIVELCRIAATDTATGIHGLLRRVAELAAEGLPGVEGASVVVGDPAEATAAAWSSPMAQAADGLQHLAGEGPMFQAHAGNQVLHAADLFGDDRWPHLSRIPGTDRCTRSALAFPVTLGPRAAGVVVLYSGPRAPLGRGVAAQAAPYVAAVQSLIRDTQALDELAAIRDQLKDALTSRAVIDQAKGMIMMTRGCTADEAFAVLARMSSSGGRKVRELAADFVSEVSQGRRRFR